MSIVNIFCSVGTDMIISITNRYAMQCSNMSSLAERVAVIFLHCKLQYVVVWFKPQLDFEMQNSFLDGAEIRNWYLGWKSFYKNLITN